MLLGAHFNDLTYIATERKQRRREDKKKRSVRERRPTLHLNGGCRLNETKTNANDKTR